MTFIAVDLGTSFIKGAVLDLDTLSINHIQRMPFPEPVTGLPPLFYEVEPEAIVSTFRTFVTDLLTQAPECAGLVMCSQMHGLIVTDGRGEPVSNCLTWQDQRALLPHPSGEGSYFEVMASRLSPTEHRQLGNELKPSLPLCYLFWLVEEQRLPPGKLIVTTLPDYVLARLSGAVPATAELTYAAAHGALNLETLAWHREVIAKLGLDHLQWPALHPFGEVVAEIDVGSQRLPCYTPAGDHQAAVAGACLGDEELSINVATASQVTMLTPHLTLGDYQTRPFFDDGFMNTIARIPAGRSLDGLVNLLTELAAAQQISLDDSWPYIAEAAAAVDQTDLQVDLSFFASTVGNRGQIANIQEDNLTVGHLFRAAFEHMAGNYYACGQRLSPEPAWQRLVFSGGLVQKLEILRRIIAAKFQLEYRVSPSSEDTLLGLLALALVASGRVESVREATRTLLERYETE